jgi:hypothetical protein
MCYSHATGQIQHGHAKYFMCSYPAPAEGVGMNRAKCSLRHGRMALKGLAGMMRGPWQ